MRIVTFSLLPSVREGLLTFVSVELDLVIADLAQSIWDMGTQIEDHIEGEYENDQNS